MQGWIKLHRQFIEWEWYKDLKTKSLFLHFLLTANIADRKYMGFMIHPGQTVTTLPRLAAETGLTEMECRTAIKHLKNTKEISEIVTNKFRVITIEKWALYQGIFLDTNRQITANQQTTNSQLTGLEKEEEKEKKFPNISLSMDVPSELLGFDTKELREVRESWRAAGRMDEWINAYSYAIEKNPPKDGCF